MGACRCCRCSAQAGVRVPPHAPPVRRSAPAIRRQAPDYPAKSAASSSGVSMSTGGVIDTLTHTRPWPVNRYVGRSTWAVTSEERKPGNHQWSGSCVRTRPSRTWGENKDSTEPGHQLPHGRDDPGGRDQIAGHRGTDRSKRLSQVPTPQVLDGLIRESCKRGSVPATLLRWCEMNHHPCSPPTVVVRAADMRNGFRHHEP